MCATAYCPICGNYPPSDLSGRTWTTPTISVSSTKWPPEGYHLHGGKCPNAGSACNCTGKCRPALVKDDDAA